MADEQAQDKVEKKSNLKLFLIIGVAMVIAAAATFGAMSFMGGNKAEATEEKKPKHEPTAIYSLDPFIVNIYDGQELRYLKIKVEMDIADEEAKNELTTRQAQIRDSILVILTAKTLQDIQSLQGKTQLKQEILSAVTGIASPGKVKQIFFTDFVVQ